MKKQFFINLSNHSSQKWSKEQREAACAMLDNPFSNIVDLDFPNVLPTSTTAEVHELALAFFWKVREIVSNRGCVIHIAGEPTFVTHFVNLASIDGKPCVTATSERISREETLPDGTTRKIADFKFVQWRRIDNLPFHF